MWGPWIDHCGTHRPVEKGQLVHVVGEYTDGEIVEKEYVVKKDAWSWYSFNYGRDYGNGSIPRVLRYRVWTEPERARSREREMEIA